MRPANVVIEVSEDPAEIRFHVKLVTAAGVKISIACPSAEAVPAAVHLLRTALETALGVGAADAVRQKLLEMLKLANDVTTGGGRN